jgi:salicylate hydroxylase
LEDALILSRLLGQVNETSQLASAFQVYDAIRRPRAQAVVRTSQEAGDLYSFSHPEIGADMDKIVENFQQRFLWIWEHDLEGDVRLAEQHFRALMSAS